MVTEIKRVRYLYKFFSYMLQANNLVIKLFGEKRFSTPDLKLKNHVDLVEFLGIADTKRGNSTLIE